MDDKKSTKRTLMPNRYRSLPTFCLMLTCCLLALLLSTGAKAYELESKPHINLSPQLSVYQHQGSPTDLHGAQLAYSRQAFAPASSSAKASNFGLTQAQIWLRTELDTPSDTPTTWLLEVAHASLDDVDLYLAREGEPFQHQHSGDHIAFSAKPIQHRNHVFELQLQPNSHYILYLSVASEGTLAAPVSLWQPYALWHQDQLTYSMLSVYYGLLLALLVYNLFLYLSLRDPLYLIYVAFISCLAIGQAGLSGLVGQFIWPDNAWLTNLTPTTAVAAAGFFGAMFVQRFLAQTPRRIHLQWLMPSISCAYAATAICAIFWSYHLAAVAVNLISLLFAASAFLLGAVSLYFKEPGARFFVLAWVSFLSGVAVISLHNLGILPSNALTANALAIGSGLEMLLLSLALADRISDIQHSRDQAQALSLHIRQQMLENVRESERLLEARVTERTLELEQANKQLQQSQQLLEQQAKYDPLTGLGNRSLLAERLQEAQARADRRQTRFALLVADLDRFKNINDRLGHAAGDEVLVEIARRLNASVRATDVVARMGGDEFILVLESVGDHADLPKLHTKIREAICTPIVLSGGETVSVGVSIGSAFYPDDAANATLLFNHADRAMYDEKPTI
ncbi:diguanylate cyclase domain-containing protein [Pseudomonas neustonica]|uniref:diguanylate cyclase n=1 Tax=Pseudomonas TaxID=286 RepID=UPI0015F3C5D8|nr:diguanylate cyclase [Pseudomonas sp. 5Ae-yellow]MBA6418392.1 GGDEF domain-containing protein [Pseudomonas sp. 5Ae-yellow]|tara:strand:+ start:19333 stop:21204 length:1872 start_codon:yes stop_codon:yes gene_type:complete